MTDEPLPIASEDMEVIDLDTLEFDVVARNVCALLNARGGRIDLPKGRIDGLEAELKARITPTALFAFDVSDSDKRASIEVPPGADGPYVLGGAVWIRQDQTSIPADAATLRTLILSRAESFERWERRISLGLTFEDLDFRELTHFVQDVEASRRFTFIDGNNFDEVLNRLALKQGSDYTQACDVLFTARPAIRHPQVRVQYLRYSSDKLSDHYADSEYLEGPSVQTFENLFRMLRASTAVESRFEENTARRVDRPAYAHAALREGLVNAFVHRDYSSFSGGLKVSVYPSRIEIWNSGSLPDGLNPIDLRREHPSLPINPDIMHVFYLRGLVEKAGRGTEKIIAACKDIDAPSPIWSQSQGVKLTLFSALAEPSDEALEALNDRQAAAIAALPLGEEISSTVYARRFAPEIGQRQARRDLIELERMGWVRRVGEARLSVYRRVR